jgi:hypothetical protein
MVAVTKGIIDFTEIGPIWNKGVKKPLSVLLNIVVFLGLLSFILPISSYASSGTEGASFLDIPVGAGPASMGAAYSALANDAYASTLNPGGLGFLPSTQFAAQHLSYIDSVYYEHLSFAVPLPRSSNCLNSETCPGSALGGSIQYLGSGDINGTDVNANPTGTFSTHYAAYNLSYGRSLTDKLSLGVTGKLINAKIDNVSANAYAADFGSMYRASDKLTLAAVLTNLGTKLTFLDQSDSLPLAFHLGAAYRLTNQWNMSAEGVYPQTGLASAHFGLEWQPLQMIAIRAGYRTDTVKELGAMAGFTTGVGLHAFGQEFAYAWVPAGDLGNTHYFSLLVHLGEADRAKRNLIQYQTIKQHRAVQGGTNDSDPDYQQLMEMIQDDHVTVAQPITQHYPEAE